MWALLWVEAPGSRLWGSVYDKDVLLRAEFKQTLTGIPFGSVLGRPKDKDFKKGG